MDIKILSSTPTSEQAVPVRETIGTRTLSNNPCNVTLTVQLEGNNPIQVTLHNENEVRNVIARFVPTEIIDSASTEVRKHLNNDLNELFSFMLTEAKAQGLSLPQGI